MDTENEKMLKEVTKASDDLYHKWTMAVLSENKEKANEAYKGILHNGNYYGVWPEIFRDKPSSAKQFYNYNSDTGFIE